MKNPENTENKRKTSLAKLKDELIQAMRTSNSESRKDIYQSIIDRIESEYLEIEKREIINGYIESAKQWSDLVLSDSDVSKDAINYYNKTFIS